MLLQLLFELVCSRVSWAAYVPSLYYSTKDNTMAKIIAIANKKKFKFLYNWLLVKICNPKNVQVFKQLCLRVFVSLLVQLRKAAWWPDSGTDCRWQGHCWPEGPRNVGMAVGKGHLHSTVSIITVMKWWKSCRAQQAQWSTFTHPFLVYIHIW